MQGTTYLQPCRLEDVVGNGRGVNGAPPSSVIASGVACLPPKFMRDNHLYLYQPVQLRVRCSDENIVVAHAWPLNMVSDGFVALDSSTLSSLQLDPTNLSSGRADRMLISGTTNSPHRRAKPSQSKDNRSPRAGRHSPATAKSSRSIVRESRFELDRADNIQDDSSHVEVVGLNQQDIEEASALTLTPESIAPTARGALLSDIYTCYLGRILMRRIVTKGTRFTATLLGSDVQFVVRNFRCAVEATMASVTPGTRVEVNHTESSKDISCAVAPSAPTALRDGDLECISAVGGLSTQIDAILGLARAAFAYKSGGLCKYDLSGRRPRGVLMYGPPGTGKTMLARGIASACGAKLEVLNGPDIVGANSGESEAALSSAFRRSSRNSPCVLLLDEVDAIAPRRDGVNIGSAERRLTAALLTLIDGSALIAKESISADRDGIFILGTTNRPDAIDPALRRAGRFDRDVEIPVPDARGRFDILSRIVGIAQSSGVLDVEADELNDVARRAYGFVGADLAALWRESVTSAARRCRSDSETEVRVNIEDLNCALGLIKPSALREVEVEIPHVRWTDIGGMDHVKARLREAIELPLSSGGAKLFRSIGVTPPRGILLFGPPGCSKTLLAKAVATESGANFISVKGPELLSMWVGESEKAIRETFRKARLAAPCVIFFDEIDALASARGMGGSATSRVVAQLLTEIDGIGSPSHIYNEATIGDGAHNSSLTTSVSNPLETRVVVIAATNRPDLLDAALVRPGRLGVQLHVGLPDEAGRIAVLRVHCSRVPVAADVNIEGYAVDGGPMDKMTGAEVAAVVREAALAAMEEDLDHAREVCPRHFDRALQRVRPRTPAETLDFFERYVKQTRNVLV
jgi:SpoVK/Ycf46/Vps4 family AAA+-type ATPase